MPILAKPQLTLVDQGDQVTATVSFQLTYHPLEVALLNQGLVFRARVVLMADDAVVGVGYSRPAWGPPVPDGTLLFVFPEQALAIPTPDALTQIESRSHVLDRTALDEDGAWWSYYRLPLGSKPEFRREDDEIKARVTIAWDGLPFPPISADSDLVTLLDRFTPSMSEIVKEGSLVFPDIKHDQ